MDFQSANFLWQSLCPELDHTNLCSQFESSNKQSKKYPDTKGEGGSWIIIGGPVDKEVSVCMCLCNVYGSAT